jgi:hypothetical protein
VFLFWLYKLMNVIFCRKKNNLLILHRKIFLFTKNINK